MVSALPPRIMDYRVSPSSPTGELLTLGNILAEVGDYASTVLDREHLSFSKRCGAKLRHVAHELKARRCIAPGDGIFALTAPDAVCPELCEVAPSRASLTTLSVGELYRMFRNGPRRRSLREAAGREPLTYYPEGDIVYELLHRRATDRDEQLKIDYCSLIYRNELDNLSTALSLPLKTVGARPEIDLSQDFTADELRSLIVDYSSYADIAGREDLIRLVDRAIDLVGPDTSDSAYLELLAELTDIGRRGIIRIPGWVDTAFRRNITAALADPHFDELRLAIPLLTLHLITGDPACEHRAAGIINRAYRSAFDAARPAPARLRALRLACDCADYVTAFSPRRAASLAARLSSYDT